MSATILAFPRPSPIRALCRDRSGSAPFTPAWCAEHLPLIDAAMDLLEADDAEFGRRCALMCDEDGRAMLDELAGQLQRLGAHIAGVTDALGADGGEDPGCDDRAGLVASYGARCRELRRFGRCNERRRLRLPAGPTGSLDLGFREQSHRALRATPAG